MSKARIWAFDKYPGCHKIGWKQEKIDTRGVLKFGFGKDTLPWNLKVDPYKYQFFKKKWPIHIKTDQFWPAF